MLLGLAIAVGAGAAIAIALRLSNRAREQATWPRVRVKITVSRVDYWSGSTQPRIEYNYTFSGRTFWSDRVCSPSLTLYLPEGARRVVIAFTVGTEVDVYVDPSNPAFSVLVPGGDKRFL